MLVVDYMHYAQLKLTQNFKKICFAKIDIFCADVHTDGFRHLKLSVYKPKNYRCIILFLNLKNNSSSNKYEGDSNKVEIKVLC
jgi:hypothetical protein